MNNVFWLSLRTARGLLVLNGVIWLFFGIISLLRLGDQPAVTLVVIALLMFGNVAAFLLAAWWLGRETRLSFYFALAVLIVNILLTFTDQVGLFDWLTVLIDAAALAILLLHRPRFL